MAMWDFFTSVIFSSCDKRMRNTYHIALISACDRSEEEMSVTRFFFLLTPFFYSDSHSGKSNYPRKFYMAVASVCLSLNPPCFFEKAINWVDWHKKIRVLTMMIMVPVA